MAMCQLTVPSVAGAIAQKSYAFSRWSPLRARLLRYREAPRNLDEYTRKGPSLPSVNSTNASEGDASGGVGDVSHHSYRIDHRPLQKLHH